MRAQDIIPQEIDAEGHQEDRTKADAQHSINACMDDAQTKDIGATSQ